MEEQNKIRFEYNTGGEHIVMDINSMQSLENIVDSFRRFLMSIGFNPDSVCTYSTYQENDDRMCIIKQDIKNAWDCVDSKQYDEAVKYLTRAYEG